MIQQPVNIRNGAPSTLASHGDIPHATDASQRDTPMILRDEFKEMTQHIVAHFRESHVGATICEGKMRKMRGTQTRRAETHTQREDTFKTIPLPREDIL